MHFLRLLRPINLAVIIFTMMGMRLFFLPFIPKSGIQGESFDYFLLILSTVLIAAAGNIINDYFDVKADRINKPEKLIIGKYIKPRWAILSHWVFNFIAFAIACYLSWRYSTFWYVFIHLLSINALWFYSMILKRKFFIGNIVIALLTGLVPILCGIHFLNITTPFNKDFIPENWIINSESWIVGINLKVFFVLFFALFAAGLNLAREIVKDMEDIEGDLILKAKTLPIVLGNQRVKWIAVLILIAILLLPTPFIWEAFEVYGVQFIQLLAPAGFIVLGIILCIILLIFNTDKKALHRIDLFLKIIMVIGCSLPFYWFLR